MGGILSRFRSKKTTKDILESLEKDIKNLQSTLNRNRELQKNIVLLLVLGSVLTYIISAIIVYIWLLPDKWIDRALWILLFVGFPFLMFFLKKILHFIFVTRINKNAKEIETLHEKKKEILEDITETETYKVAKELLERFDPSGKIIARESPLTHAVPKKASSEQELRFRHNAGKIPIDLPLDQGLQAIPIGRPMSQGPPPIPIGRPLAHGHKAISMPALKPTGSPSAKTREREMGVNPRPRPSPIVERRKDKVTQKANGKVQVMPNVDYRRVSLPNPIVSCPILPRDRSFFDKVAEYFVGDGPGYRFALICSNCHSHNGMALEDEFKYIEFRCCYCGAFNAARAPKPCAPSLKDNLSSSQIGNMEGDSSSDREDQRGKKLSDDDDGSEENQDKTDSETGGDDSLQHSEEHKPENNDDTSNMDVDER